MSHPFPLGRKVFHDERSKNFPARTLAGFKPVAWTHYGPILDQGNIGSCTGNAMAQALNTKPLHVRGEHLLKEPDALRLYSLATTFDNDPGQYPPDDTGSTGLAVAKAAVNLGYIGRYTHAFGLEHGRGALQLGPVLFGTNWYEGMFNPDSKGYVWPTGQIAGGHEYLCLRDTGYCLEFLNSWGPAWGKHGRFRMTYQTAERLLNEQGDITVPA